jgi:hypothetical protein
MYKTFFKSGLKVTAHFQERLHLRLAGLVTVQEVAAVLERIPELQVGQETWVFVKRLDAPVNAPGAWGDEIWIVCKRPDGTKRGDVVNIILRGSNQPRNRSKIYIGG